MLTGHLLLTLSVLALAAAALRAVSPLVDRGLVRALATITVAVGLAVVEALGLGLVELGTTPLALAAAAIATWLASRALFPAPELPPAVEVASAWSALGTRERVLVGAVAGLGLAIVVWPIRTPDLGFGVADYHQAQAISWIHDGQPGSIVEVGYEFPVGNYPLTNEVVLAWIGGLAGSLGAMSVWPPAMLLLLGAAGWTGLRTVRVPMVIAALAIAALCVQPLVFQQGRQAITDLPALAWLVTAATLAAAGARRDAHPGLLAVALLAAGLSVGTKTTTLPLAALAVGSALWIRRDEPRIRRAALLGVAAALAVGGIWYIRNLVDHGSPLWPFVATPWGDPIPPLFELVRPSLLDTPSESLSSDRLPIYGDLLAGGIVLIAGGVLAPLLARRRAVLLAAGATALALLFWLNAPVTGAARRVELYEFSLDALRYLMPTMAAGALALALVGRDGSRRAAWLAGAVLSLALVANLIEGRDPPPLALPVMLPLAGVAAGAFAGLLASLVSDRWPPASSPAGLRIGGATAILVAAIAVATSSTGTLERYAESQGSLRDTVLWFLSEPEYADDERPIFFAPNVIGLLSGNELRHDVELIPGSEPCPEIRERARQGWVVVRTVPTAPGVLTPYTAGECLAREEPAFDAPVDQIRVYTLPG